MKQLIVHADDLGMGHSVNQGCFESLIADRSTCGSVMMPCPWVREVEFFARDYPGIDLGVHLTLNCERKGMAWGPCASPDQVSSLLSEDGSLLPTVKDTVLKAKPQEVEIELRAQIQKAIQLGIRPSHIDTHMGTLFSRVDFIEAYFKVADEFSIPAMAVKWSQGVEEELVRRNLPVKEIQKILEKEMKSGRPLLDALITNVPGEIHQERVQIYLNILRNLPEGTTQLIVHPGIYDNEMQGLYTRYGKSGSFRQSDLDCVMSSEWKETLSQEKIRTLSWREWLAEQT